MSTTHIHIATPGWALLILLRNVLLSPGAALHEIAHWIVGRRYGQAVIHWGLTRSETRVEWNETVPVWGVVGFYLAPMFLAGGLLIVTAPFVSVLGALPPLVQVYLAVQFLVLVGPSWIDISQLVATLLNQPP